MVLACCVIETMVMALDIAVLVDVVMAVTMAVDFVVAITFGTAVFIPIRLFLAAPAPESGSKSR